MTDKNFRELFPIGAKVEITNPILWTDEFLVGEVHEITGYGDSPETFYLSVEKGVEWYPEEVKLLKEEESTMTNQDALAVEIAALDARIKVDTEKLKNLKDQLIKKVGPNGAKIETVTATVTVTQQTYGRPTGTFSYGLDSSVFMSQDEHVKANLIKQGIVTQTEKVISGTAPTVKVKAK